MIFAAGLGTRLRPLTDTMPKALVPVGGKPMLERVLLKLKAAGFTEVVVNIHHRGQQIVDFLRANHDFGLTIHISDERDALLDTGGGILKARIFFEHSDEPFLVHNVDILSDADLSVLYERHRQEGSVATLLASRRETSRYLLFDNENRLRGWTNKATGEMRPAGFRYDTVLHRPYAFSGIHVLSPSVFGLMDKGGWQGKFSIMDFYLSVCGEARVMGCLKDELLLVDIGKPETLEQAERLFI
jgi:NDP-sugar pyrophosphorylase family protein